jgi:hypothetical protein
MKAVLTDFIKIILPSIDVFSGKSGKIKPVISISLVVMGFTLFMHAKVEGQTDFLPGEIMFTGYNSDNPDGFSIVILKDVVNGTVIYITDRGWSSTTGFRDDSDGEGTISLTFNFDYPCGTTIIFEDVGGANDWTAMDVYGNTIGTVAILTSTGESPNQDMDGIEFNVGTSFPFPDGDQLFIYQSPEPNPANQSAFVTGIQMNGPWNTGNGDDYSSAKPSGLADNQVVRFNTEVDNAKYNCAVVTGSSSALQAAIENDNGGGTLISDASNNWVESNTYLNLFPACNFCCGSTPPTGAPVITAPSVVSLGEVFIINISGTLGGGAVWELYLDGCGIGTPVQTTTSSSFSVTAPSIEGTYGYYVRSSAEVDCGAICDYVEVGVCSGNNQETCIDCTPSATDCACIQPETAANPELDSGCFEIKLIFILDESGSIGEDADSVELGVMAFLNALNGQDIQAAIIEFSDLARVVTNYTTINNSFIINMNGYFNGAPFNGQTYNPLGGTNWHDAMIKADAMEPADILLFFTDGIPTGWTNPATNNVDYCGNGSTTQTPEIVNPVKLANKLKGEDTHIFMLGVGDGISAPNLQLMSGLIEYDPDIHTIGNSDYALGSFNDLAADLADFVQELCETELIIDKQLLGSVCNGEQQFMFIMHNPGMVSAATGVQLFDTFPSGYTNIVYNGNPFIKLCIGAQCANQNQPMPDNGFIWSKNSLAPGASDTLILTVTVLDTGNYTNFAWATAFNVGGGFVYDSVTGDSLNDDLSPLITCPDNISIECSESTLPSNTGEPTSSDPDGTEPDHSYVDSLVTGSCPDEYTIYRTWTATDGCNNTATCVQTIVVEDTSPPVLTCPPDVTINCTASTAPASTGIATAIDSCDASPSVTSSDIIIGGSCVDEYVIERTWTATDTCGNESTCVQIISIEDNTGPAITCPPNLTISCTENTQPANTGSATATDICDPMPAITFTDDIANGSCLEYTITRTWKATDVCGNFTTCVQIISLEDNEMPAITCPPNVTIACTEGTLPENTGTATASDMCDPSPDITYTHSTVTGACPQEYVITRLWVATDDCGNSSTCIQTIAVEDNTGPLLTCPPNITIQCTASTLPVNTGTATATDGCDATSIITYSDVSVSGSCPQEYTITRTWMAEDDCGNISTCAQMILIDDSMGPVLTCPPNVTIECTASTLPEQTGNASATDNCDLAPNISYLDATTNGSCPQEHTINRTWTATDDCGNTSTCVQVIFIDDSTPPVITCPPNVTIQCTAVTEPSNTGTATATDNCGGTSVLTYTNSIVNGTCAQEYTITRTWTATDPCGNTSTCNQIIVIEDTVAPSITCPAGITIECTESTLPANTGSATGTDNCDASPVINHSDVISNGSCPEEYTITRTWSITDDCLNNTTCIQVITVQDFTPPAITCPANVTIECTASTLPANTGSPTSSDNCDAVPEVTYSDATIAGSCPQEYTITRTWTSTDGCGNFSTCAQTITVEDSTVPVITCPANVTIECNTDTQPSATGSATASDNCGAAPMVTHADVTVAGSCPQEYTITRTWTATDACGNTSTCIQTVTIDDSTAPLITCPANITLECLDDTTPGNTGTATSTDVCDASPGITHSDVTISGPLPNGYTIQRTWTATDVCGNSSTCLQTIIVENPIDPMINGMTTDTICSGQSVSFTATDQGIGSATYEWNFGSGSAPSSATGIGPHNVTYTYNATNGSEGAHVLLTVTIAGCASVTDTVGNVHVNAIPNPAIDAPGTPLCYFKVRVFKPVAPFMPGYSYLWDFGPGASLPPTSGYGPHNVEYSTTGSKTVKLIVHSNEPGSSCSDTATLTFNVVACPGNVTGRVRRPDGTGIGSVNVRLYNDADLNGLPDGPSIRSVFTTMAGLYSITNIVPGQYVLGQTDLPNYYSLYELDETDDMDTVVFDDPNDNLIPVTMEAQEIDADNVFVDVINPSIISGYVFEDMDNDGQPDGNEGIDSVAVQLFADTDQNGEPDSPTPLFTVYTAPSGFYAFGDLMAGDYVIVQIQPDGYDSVEDVDFSNDSDEVENTDTTDDIIPVTLVSGEIDANNYFKETNACSGIVTNTNDSGPGSLREIIDCIANGGTIGFHPSLADEIIHLTSDRIIIDKDVNINSTLSPRVWVYSDIPGAFKINSGSTVQFKNINFTSGLSGTPGAAFENYGHLILWDASVVRNPMLLPGNHLIYNGVPGILTAKGVLQIEVD